jgi:hypothetical protein
MYVEHLEKCFWVILVSGQKTGWRGRKDCKENRRIFGDRKAEKVGGDTTRRVGHRHQLADQVPILPKHEFPNFAHICEKFILSKVYKYLWLSLTQSILLHIFVKD